VDNAKLVHRGRCRQITQAPRARIFRWRGHTSALFDSLRWWMYERHPPYGLLLHVGADSSAKGLAREGYFAAEAAPTEAPKTSVGWTRRSLSTKAGSARSCRRRARADPPLARVARFHISALFDSLRWWMEERHPPYGLLLHVGPDSSAKGLARESPFAAEAVLTKGPETRVGWTRRSLSTKAGVARPRRRCARANGPLAGVPRLHTSALFDSLRWWMEERHPPYGLLLHVGPDSSAKGLARERPFAAEAALTKGPEARVGWTTRSLSIKAGVARPRRRRAREDPPLA